MGKVFNLSYVVDKDGKKRVDLASFNTLEELDDFIVSNFTTTEDVRYKYKEVIDIFREKNKATFENSKNPGYRASIVITYEDGKDVRRIPVMYKDGRKMKSIEECKEIFTKLYTDKIIIKDIRDNKKSIFTSEEMDYLYFARYYLDYQQWGSRDEQAFQSFADRFYKRIITKSKDEHELYYHFRYMMDYFPFSIGENKEHIVITDIEADKLSQIERNKIYHDLYHGGKEIIKYSEVKTPDREGVEVESWAPEEFKYAFYKALDTGDFDLLYNTYSLEEIEKYTHGKRK